MEAPVPTPPPTKFIPTISYTRADVIDAHTLATKEITEYYIPTRDVTFNTVLEGNLIGAWGGSENLFRKPYAGVFPPGKAGQKQRELDASVIARDVKPGPPLPEDVVDAIVLLILMEDQFKAVRKRTSEDLAEVLKPATAGKK